MWSRQTVRPVKCSYILVPRSRQSLPPPDPGDSRATGDYVCDNTRGPPRILCVDDNHDVADSTVELLLLIGYDARACYDGASALLLAESYHPDVCLIDLNMPGMDGDELAVRLRASEQPMILVAATAASHAAGCRRIREAGFDHHLVKPVALAALLAVLGG